MQLKAIDKLENFPPFKENHNTSVKCDNFERFNLIYALNGTGKTTLTRFMSLMSWGEIPQKYEVKYEAYKNFNACIKTDDGINIQINETTLANSPLKGKIKVFNSDFIENNLNFENAQANTLFCEIGSEKIELKEKQKKIKKILKLIFTDETYSTKRMSKEIDNVKGKLEELYKYSAQEYRLSVNNQNSASFKSNHIKPEFDKDFSNYIPLTEKERDDFQKVAIENPKIPVDFDYESIANNFIKEERYQNIKKLLKEIFKRSSVAEKEDIISWLEKGMKIHESESICKFCGKPLSPIDKEERFTYIKSLMQKDIDFERTEQELREHYQKISELKQYAEQALNFTIKTDDFLERHKEEAKTALETLNFLEEKSAYIKALDIILNKISEKMKNLDQREELELAPNDYLGLGLKLQNFQKIVDENNRDCTQQQKIKKDALETIKKQIVYENLEKNNSLKKLLKNYEQINEHWDKILERILELKKEVDNALSNQTLPIQKIENICKNIFGVNKFTFRFDNVRKVYEILRNGSPANNISEGEKTVIAFAYFIASLEEISSKNADIIVIDDPISSLDQQYLFNLSSVLAQKVINPHVPKKQFFVLTHNFFFFRKVRNYFSQLSKDVKLFEIIKEHTGSYISNASEYLQKKEGEYLYLINFLKKEYEKEEEKCPGLGNIIRQILEIFLFFKEPSSNTIYVAFKQLLKDRPNLDKYLYLSDMANSTSHPIDQDSVIHDFDYMKPIGKKEIEELFYFINEVDPEHARKLKLPISF